VPTPGSAQRRVRERGRRYTPVGARERRVRVDARVRPTVDDLKRAAKAAHATSEE